MKNQITVNIADIPASWDIASIPKIVPHYLCEGDECDICYGEGCLMEVSILKVKFPKSGWITSMLSDYLLFDLDSNHKFKLELMENKIPFCVK